MSILDTSIQLSDALSGLATEFISGSRPRLLFGCNEHSAALAKLFNVTAFIDDFITAKDFEKKPIIKTAEIPQDAIVVNCVMAIKPLSAQRKAESKSSRVIDYGSLLSFDPGRVPTPDFCRDARIDFNSNQDKWSSLKLKLADEASRKILDDLIHFRLTALVHYMTPYKFAPEEQYFDPVVRLAKRSVFVDCGGFDGDTTEQFIQRFPDYASVQFFEPSDDNMKKAKARLASASNIHYHPQGVSDQCGELSFNPDAGSASSVSEAGRIRIPVTTIDSSVCGPVSFIKMDLEGWEISALRGARQTIQNHSPVLAIAIYHRASDFWMIPELVLEWQPAYDIYLRHYTEGWTETIMYFVPKQEV